MKESEFVDRILSKYIKDEELKRLLITHSRCVAEKAVDIGHKMGLKGEELQFIYDASMLHDIGVVECDAPGIHCFGTRPYICHGLAGSEILKKEGLDNRFARVCERHTGSGLTAAEIERQNLPLPHRDFLPETLPEKIICYADKFFSKSAEPSKEKSRERVIASIARHGEEALRRFNEMDSTFSA